MDIGVCYVVMCWCWRGGTKVTRKWEVFAGRNRFWCDGRVMTAPQPGVFLLTLTLITVTCAVHFAFDCVYLAARVSPAVPAAGVALTVITVASLLRTALTDPGIIPRASPSEAAVTDASPTQRPPPRTREVLIRGRPVKLKYCFTCKMFRPPRASHCSLCDNCVDRFDHHCPWVGNCVGRRNYRFFYTFVVSLSFLCVWVFSCGVAALVLEARGGGGVGAALRARPPSALVAAVAFLAVWSVLGLAGFHTYLASTDQTTNEDIKGSFSSSRNGGPNPNPYSRGNACSNCWNVLCGPLAPSLIDRRGLVTVSDNVPVVTAPPTHNGFGGSYTNLYESGDGPIRGIDNGAIGTNVTNVTNGAMLQGNHTAPHAYMNHTLELDSLPPQEPPALLSASRLRLLHDTTMIDAALDLDDPLHYAPPVPPASVTHGLSVTHSTHSPAVPHGVAHYGPPVPHTIVRLPP